MLIMPKINSWKHLLLIVSYWVLCHAGFKQQLETSVSVPFAKVIRDYGNAIGYVKRIVSSYKPQQGLSPRIADQLTLSIDGFQKNLKATDKGSKSLAPVAPTKIAAQSKLVTEYQGKLEENEKQTARARALFARQRKKTRQARYSLNRANDKLRARNKELRQASADYRNQRRKCIMVGRRSVRGSRGIEIARRARRGAEEGCPGLEELNDKANEARQAVRDAQSRATKRYRHYKRERAKLNKTKRLITALKSKTSRLQEDEIYADEGLSTMKSRKNEIRLVRSRIREVFKRVKGMNRRGSVARKVVNIGHLVELAKMNTQLIEAGYAISHVSGRKASLYLTNIDLDEANTLRQRLAKLQ